jgi:low affinity Fe/Cu permease
MGKEGAGHKGIFNSFAGFASKIAGTSEAFIAALVILLAWAITGPIFHFTDTWQLVINTGTTIITFIMVFLIQNTQNRETMAIELKLDELLLATKEARSSFIDIEDLSDKDLRLLQDRFKRIREEAESQGSES